MNSNNDLNTERHPQLFIILMLAVLSLIVPTASADYDFDGVPYTDQLGIVVRGTVNGAAVDSVAALDVPDSYTGVGAKEGTLVFWAQKA
jgi:hypothetical protein